MNTEELFIIGMDLSGPGNGKDTAAAVFACRGQHLLMLEHLIGADDHALHDFLRQYRGAKVTLGLDAPLSYNPGGGDRPGDRALRAICIRSGLRSGTIMAPTMTRMAYLTLRGMAIARLAERILPAVQIVEVHPGATLALHGARVEDVLQLKLSQQSRLNLLGWLERQGLTGAADIETPGEHYVAAMAAVLAAWKYQQGRSQWLHEAEPPLHPYDYAC